MPSRRRNLLAALLAALAAALAGLQAPPAEARPLRVLTYNIHHGAGRDGRYDLGRIAEVINSFQPDLVALQEVEQGTSRYPGRPMQLDLLAELSNMTGRFGKTLNRLGGEYGNGVLVNPEFSILSVNNMTMPNPADGELRKVMKVRLEFDDDGTSRRLDFFATHMDHTSGANRQAQVDFINAEVADSNTPAILAGDFNFDDQGPAYASLMDEWRDPTAASPGRPHQIDYVVYRGLDQFSVVNEGRFIVNSTTEVASDHYPLRAVIELVPHSADFDDDGDVDGRDLLHWQRNLGATGASAVGDANHDRTVNNADRTIWAQQFNSDVNQASSAAAIPEPLGAELLRLALVAAAISGSWRRRNGASL